MEDLHYERDFEVTQAEMWALLTTEAGLVQWWGPEGVTLPDHHLDFTRPGPWYSVMQNSNGQRFRVSGHVTSLNPPHSVALTWAFDDAAGRRGADSHVTFALRVLAPGWVRLTLDHRALADAEALASHDQGWQSTLRKLQSLFSALHT